MMSPPLVQEIRREILAEWSFLVQFNEGAQLWRVVEVARKVGIFLQELVDLICDKSLMVVRGRRLPNLQFS